MAPVIADGLRACTADALKSKRTLVAYVTGCGLIVAGAVFGDGDQDPHGVTVMVIGGTLVFGGLLVPLAVSIAMRWYVAYLAAMPPSTDRGLVPELAELHDRIAVLEEQACDEVRGVAQRVERITSQLG